MKKSGPHKIVINDQVALDRNGDLIGRSFDMQLTASMINMEKALTEAGSKWNDVIHLEMRVVDLKNEHQEIIDRVLKRIFIFKAPPISNLLNVQSLFREDLVVSIDAIASNERLRSRKSETKFRFFSIY